MIGRIEIYLVGIATVSVNIGYSRIVYNAVSTRQGSAEGFQYAISTFILPILFGVQFLYEYGKIFSETKNLSTFSRMVVAAFVVMIGPLPLLALVAPPDPFTLARLVGVALLAVTPVAYLLLFPLVGFDIRYQTGSNAAN